MDNSLPNYTKSTHPKYQVGGRWTGYFKPKADAVGYLGEPGAFDNKPTKTYYFIKINL